MMVLFILSFAVGVWLLQLQPALPPLAWAGGLAAGPLLVLLLQGAGGVRRVLRRVVILSTALACGFAWAAWLAHIRMADALPGEWEGRDITLTGVVATLPQSYERSVRFEFDVEQVRTPEAQVPRRIVQAGGELMASIQGSLRRGDYQKLLAQRLAIRRHSMVEGAEERSPG